MKIICADHESHSELSIRNEDGYVLHSYTFSTPEERKAFIMGFKCCQIVENSVIQSIPTDYKLVKK